MAATHLSSALRAGSALLKRLGSQSSGMCTTTERVYNPLVGTSTLPSVDGFDRMSDTLLSQAVGDHGGKAPAELLMES